MLRACATVLLLCSASLWGGTSVQIRVAHANARSEPNSSAQIVAVPEDVRGLPASDPRKTYLTALEARPVMAVIVPKEHWRATRVGTWRGTAWEVHPITRIEVLENGQWRSIE